jgi:tungstate transport system substrate-binding protein
MIQKKHCVIIILLFAAIFYSACGVVEYKDSEESASRTSPDSIGVMNEFPELINREMILSTTTSTENSGLLDFILPDFKDRYGIEVKVIAVGSGAALQMGADGEADVVLAHAKIREEELVAKGHGVARYDVMYNDFIIIGPPNDPANLISLAPADVAEGMKIIHEHQTVFVSRGDDSGTHIMELDLWKNAGIEKPEGRWYISSGQGMGEVIQMADELEGYTLTDRGTYLSMTQQIDLVIIVEGDPKLFNQYGVTAINPDQGDHINYPAAVRFVHWILSPETQDLISQFGMEEHGTSLFFPNATK